jgi:hypothetical protein
MNDSKWDKLISRLTEDIFCLQIANLYMAIIFNTIIRVEDYKPFFEEPILYKEIEWIEWPSELFIGKTKKNNF